MHNIDVYLIMNAFGPVLRLCGAEIGLPQCHLATYVCNGISYVGALLVDSSPEILIATH